MKIPQVPAMPGMTPLGIPKRNRVRYLPNPPIYGVPLNSLSVDQKTVAEHKWQSRKLAPAPQKPCDLGLFSDDANQLDLMEKCK